MQDQQLPARSLAYQCTQTSGLIHAIVAMNAFIVYIHTGHGAPTPTPVTVPAFIVAVPVGQAGAGLVRSSRGYHTRMRAGARRGALASIVRFQVAAPQMLALKSDMHKTGTENISNMWMTEEASHSGRKCKDGTSR